MDRPHGAIEGRVGKSGEAIDLWRLTKEKRFAYHTGKFSKAHGRKVVSYPWCNDENANEVSDQKSRIDAPNSLHQIVEDCVRALKALHDQIAADEEKAIYGKFAEG